MAIIRQFRDYATGDARTIEVTTAGEFKIWNADQTVVESTVPTSRALTANITGAASTSVAAAGSLELTLTGNLTSLTFTGWPVGYHRVRVTVVQDATGGRTFTPTTITGTWVAPPADPKVTTANSVQAQFYALSTDGGATVWLESAAGGSATKQSAEGSTPSWANLAAATLTADTDNWAAPATTVGWRVDSLSGGNRNLTGIVAPAASGAQSFWLVNLSAGQNNISLRHADTGSTAANQFLLPNAANLNIRYATIVVLAYVQSVQRWLVVSHVA